MLNKRISVAVAILALTLVVMSACGSTGISATNTPSTTATSATGVITQPTSGSITPNGPLRVGNTWMITVHSAQAYPNNWNAPTGMPGRWSGMGRDHMAVVFDVSVQSTGTPAPSTSTQYAGPACTLRGGWSMMGPMMDHGYYGWHMQSPGLYRGPMAYMAPTSTRQFTLVCTDAATRNQASWNVGF